MSQMKRVPSGGPYAMLDDEQYEAWRKLNSEAFERLPRSIRDAITDTGLDMDCLKLERCLEIGIPELSIIAAIHERERESRDGSSGITFAYGRDFKRLN